MTPTSGSGGMALHTKMLIGFVIGTVAGLAANFYGGDAGWLDVRHEPEAPSPAELAFLDLARQVWRAQNAKGKRELQRLVRDFS